METLSTILDLANLEAGEFEMDPGRVDLEEAAGDAVALLRVSAEKRGLSIRIEKAEMPVIGHGDCTAVPIHTGPVPRIQTGIDRSCPDA